MTVWNIHPYDDTIDRKLCKFKANEPLIKNFKNFVSELEYVDDPAHVGNRKHGKYKNCFGKHLTKSHSLIYMVNYDENVVYLLDLDDHKNLYGRD